MLICLITRIVWDANSEARHYAVFPIPFLRPPPQHCVFLLLVVFPPAQSIFGLTGLLQSIFGLTGLVQSIFSLTGLLQSILGLTGLVQSIFSLTGLVQSIFGLTGLLQSILA
jgi:hypothetical protein